MSGTGYSEKNNNTAQIIVIIDFLNYVWPFIFFIFL
jgi:hypothetical protein